MNAWTSLHRLVVAGNFDPEYFEATTHLIECPTLQGNYPLHFAVVIGNEEILLHLLNAGASVTQKNRSGESILHWAARSGRTAFIKTLIKCGAQVDAVDKDGNTPLHWAAEIDDHRVIRTLLRHGADAHIANADGLTPLDTARVNQAMKSLAALLR